MTAGSFMLQLIEYTAAAAPFLDLHHNHVGSPHISLYVPDVEAKYQELRAPRRREDHFGLVQIARNMRSFYTEDPDGVARRVFAID